MAEAHEHHDDIIYPNAIPFVVLHLACFAAIWTGVTSQALWTGLALYLIRMFAVTAGYHRYFSHRSYKTSRAFQFLLAVMAQSSAQKSVLWWASKHREHHRHSDTPQDVHSPLQHGFWFSHFGWIFAKHAGVADTQSVKDLAKYPELVWLDKFPHIPAIALGIGCFLLGGWPLFVVGFCWSTVLLYHATFAINSLAHVWGKQRYFTGDDSRNNGFLAIITLGEGWHNNHHYYMASARQGFFWWEFDPTYLVLKLLNAVGVVHDLHSPPATALHGERRLSRAMIEKAAREVAAQINVAKFKDSIELNVHHIRDEVRAAAERLLGNTPSLDDVVEVAIRTLRLPTTTIS